MSTKTAKTNKPTNPNMPFSKLATHDVTLSQEFTGKLNNGRTISITRGDWECTPAPIRTMLLSDKTMRIILKKLIAELNSYNFNYDSNDEEYDEEFDDAMWREYEKITIQYAPYYEDIKTEPLKEGTKVFDTESQTYAVVVVSDSETTKLDNGKVVATHWLVAKY